jgi:predicted ATP-dependent protease
MDFGDYLCGQPCRISATHTPGDAGVVSIEREVSLSGRSHSKGYLTVGAYVRSHYLPHHICALHASLTFDQVHDEVDGDSASLAETLALLSNLAQIPLKQSIAVTGAIDQRGFIQAVGGVNEKIEGFFKLCHLKGFNGKQGVILPYANRADLSLRQSVLDAVEAGQFSIWTVSHIDQALALMIDGEIGPVSLLDAQTHPPKTHPPRRETIKELQAYRFPKNTFKHQVQERLLMLSEIARRFKST